MRGLRRTLLWGGVVIGAALCAASVTLAAPWAGLPVGIGMVSLCATAIPETR